MSVATAQVATHSRFKCAQCGAKIEKNVAFVLVKADGSKVHVKCAGKVLDKTVTADQIKDLETIEQADQDALKALVSPSAKPAAPAAAANNAGRPKRAAASGKRKADAPASSESEEASQEKPKKKAAPAKAKAAPAPKAKRAKKDASESEDEEDASSVSDKPAKKAKAAPKAKFTLPPDVQAKIDAAEEALADKKQDELKDMLRKNDQAFSSLKVPELIQKIADQQVRGKIPRCPKCFGGKLRYDYKGNYTCPGYANDEGHYRRCSFKAKEGEITREAWTN